MNSFRMVLLGLGLACIWVGPGYAEMGGQVFYRGGGASVSDNRGGEVFTDAVNATGAGRNDDERGYAIGAGLDIPLAPLFGNTLLGEVLIEYAKFSKKEVLQTASALDVVLPGEGGVKAVTTSKVAVSELAVVVAPKYRFELGKLRPWLIPIGLAFLVNSPPSDDSTYLDFGAHFAAGVEYRLISLLSLGLDYRYNLGSGQSHTETDYGTFGGYVGINF